MLIGGVMLGASLLLRSDEQVGDESLSIVESRGFRVSTYGLTAAGFVGLALTGLGWPASDLLVAGMSVLSGALAGWLSARVS